MASWASSSLCIEVSEARDLNTERSSPVVMCLSCDLVKKFARSNIEPKLNRGSRMTKLVLERRCQCAKPPIHPCPVGAVQYISIYDSTYTHFIYR